MYFWYGLGVNDLEERVKAYILENFCERSEAKLKNINLKQTQTL